MTNNSKRMIFCSAVVMTYALFLLPGKISKWEFFPDTKGYWQPKFSEPWVSLRTPGLKMYIKALGQYEETSRIMSLRKNSA